MGRQPNLFILGAPKCGTTSLARWLATHPDIYAPSVKEPHHYNIDEKQVYFPGRDEYLELFEGAEGFRYRLDASVWYLHSREAVSGILSDCPDARFLVCLRNPVDMAFSLHSQYLNKTGRESVSSFEKAWELSEQRLQGFFVSSLASEPRYLAYKYSCRIGSQSQRLLRLAPEESVHFVVLDDLLRDPALTLSSILDFLELPSQFPLSVSHENRAVKRRFPSLHRVIRRLARFKRGAGFGSLPQWLTRAVLRVNTKKGKGEVMSPDTRIMVTNYFLGEIEAVWEVTGNQYESGIQCLNNNLDG